MTKQDDPPRHRQLWTQEEVDRLTHLYNQMVPAKFIARELGRTPRSINGAVNRLGLLYKAPWRRTEELGRVEAAALLFKLLLGDRQ
jgi:hypothetical protein